MTAVRDALIVAGGAGSRLYPLTATTPKPMLPFCGRPLLAGMLARLAAVGVEQVWLVVGADPGPFAALRADADRLGIGLDTVPEPEPLDTAGGVLSVLDRLRGPSLVLNGDIVTDVDLDAVIAAHRAAAAAATLVLTEVEDTSAYGVCVLGGVGSGRTGGDGTRITAFVEKPAPGELPGQNAVNAGTYVLEPDALAAFPPGRCSFEREVFPGLVAAGARVEGFVSDAVWADLGTPERYRAGHRLALDGRLRWPTLDELPADADGVRIAPDAVVDVGAVLRGPILVGAGARILAGARLGPYAVVGAESVVAEDAELVDSVLGSGTRLGARVHARGLITGRGARLGDDVEVPDGTVLGDGSELPDGTAPGRGDASGDEGGLS